MVSSLRAIGGEAGIRRCGASLPPADGARRLGEARLGWRGERPAARLCGRTAARNNRVVKIDSAELHPK